MDPVITFALWVVGLAVVAAGVTGVKSAIDKRAGMGEWAEHGVESRIVV